MSSCKSRATSRSTIAHPTNRTGAFTALSSRLRYSSRAISRPAWLVFLGSFSIVALPYLVSWMMRPEEFRAMINAHHLYDANRFNVLQGTREVTSWVGLTARSEVFWDYLNPAFLFVTGRVLAWPLVVLLPVGKKTLPR